MRRYDKFFWGFRFLKYERFSRGGFFELGLKSAGFHFRKYMKSFLLRKYKNFFNIRARKFHFLKYKEFFSGWIFFIFQSRAENYTSLRPAILLKKRLWHSCFPVNFETFLRTPFLQNTSVRLLLIRHHSGIFSILTLNIFHTSC